jgi:hypothetical protein
MAPQQEAVKLERNSQEVIIKNSQVAEPTSPDTFRGRGRECSKPKGSRSAQYLDCHQHFRCEALQMSSFFCLVPVVEEIALQTARRTVRGHALAVESIELVQRSKVHLNEDGNNFVAHCLKYST